MSKDFKKIPYLISHSFIFSNYFIPVGDTVDPIPEALGARWENSHRTGCQSITGCHAHTHKHTHLSLQAILHSQSTYLHVLDSGRKTWRTQRQPTQTQGEHANLHTDRYLSSGTLELWDGNVTRCTTVSRLLKTGGFSLFKFNTRQDTGLNESNTLYSHFMSFMVLLIPAHLCYFNHIYSCSHLA